MNKRFFFVCTAAAALTVGTAAPALADPTAATITVTGGALQITVPSAVANLGTRANTVGGGAVTGALGVVVVNDARSAVAGSGWVASAISTAFTPRLAGGTAVGAGFVGYAAGDITKVGTATYTANNRADMSADLAVVTATGITGDNSATWNPQIEVRMAGNNALGIYDATITHSVL